MNPRNHTGTLYSFTTMNEDWWYHTTDHGLLKKIAVQGYIAEGSEIEIEGKRHKIKRVSAEVLAGVGDDINEFHYGEKNRYSIQLIAYVE